MPLLLNGIKQGLYKGGVKQGLYKGGVKILPEEIAPEVFTPVCMVVQGRSVAAGMKIHFVPTMKDLFDNVTNLDVLETYIIPPSVALQNAEAVRAVHFGGYIYVYYSSTAFYRFTRTNPVESFTILKPQEITDDYQTTNWLLKDLFIDPINNELCIVVTSTGKTRRLFTSSNGNTWTKIPENGPQTTSYTGAVIYPWYPNEVRDAGYLFTGGTMQWYDFATKTITNTLPKGLSSSANTTNLTNYSKELGLFYPIRGDGFIFDFKNGQKFTTKAAIFGQAAASPGGFDALHNLYIDAQGRRVVVGSRINSSVASERNQLSFWNWVSTGSSTLIGRVTLPAISTSLSYCGAEMMKNSDGQNVAAFRSGVTQGFYISSSSSVSMSPTFSVQIISNFWLT